jgi:hypothetical protein
LSDQDRFEEVNTNSGCLTRHFGEGRGWIRRRIGAVSKEMNADLALWRTPVPTLISCLGGLLRRQFTTGPSSHSITMMIARFT